MKIKLNLFSHIIYILCCYCSK